jgi:integrase
MLTDTTCKNAHLNEKTKAGKPFKLSDGKGLYLHLKPVNLGWGKYWRFNYSFDGKAKTLSFSTYPEVSLKQAREWRDEARKQIAAGIDHGEHKKAIKQAKAESAANSFEVIAREWGAKNVDGWADKNNRIKRRLELNVFPWLGEKPITEIRPKDVLACLRRIEERGALETAHRTKQIVGRVFRYAIATDRAETDVTISITGALPSAKGNSFASIVDPKAVAPLLQAIDGYNGSFVVKSALQLAPLVFVRPGELRQAEWAHIDLEAKEWHYLVTKTETQHIVPLSTQAVEILTNLKPLTGRGRFVFPSARTPNGSRPLSDVALLAALRRIGYEKTEMTVHGFRAMARTILDERLKFRPDFVEHQLAHAVKDPNGRAYNRTAFLDERHEMMQKWADYLDGLKNGSNVIPITEAKKKS